MRKAMLAGALLAFMAAAAEAQVYLEYEKRKKDWSLRVTYSSPYYYGYGGYYYSPYGYYSSPYSYYSPFGYGYGSTVSYGGLGGWSYGYPGYSYGSPYAGGVYYNYWNGPLGPTYRGYVRPAMIDTSPPPLRPRGVADRMHEFVASKELQEGKRRFRLGDYGGALGQFREAVASDTSSGLAQAHFALALAATGDYRNADKALRAAAGLGPLGTLPLKEFFRDDKEKTRFFAGLAKAGKDGALVAAWARFLIGEEEALRQLAPKDPAAKKLLP